MESMSESVCVFKSVFLKNFKGPLSPKHKGKKPFSASKQFLVNH